MPFDVSPLESSRGRVSGARVARVVIQIVPIVVMIVLDGSTLAALIQEGGVAAVVAPVAFVLAGVMVGHALGWAIRTLRQPGAPLRDRLMALFWFVMTIAAAIAWPDATSPWSAPATSLVFYATLVTFPSALAQTAGSESRPGRVATVWHRALVVVGLIAGGFVIARDVVANRDFIEGVDFYIYVYFARQVARGATVIDEIRYRYFPGVYTFWRAALAVGGGSMAGLQWAYISLLTANAALVAGIVWRTCRRPAAGLFAALWYVVLASQLDGFFGLTEPLVTLPVLAGVLVWSGRDLSGRSGTIVAIALGAGIGLGIYAKQQGALLTLGWLAIVIGARVERRDDRSIWMNLVAVPASATVVLLAAILADGHGLAPLRRGFASAAAYETEAGIVENLRFVAGQDTLVLLIVLGLGLAAWPIMVIAPRFHAALGEPWARVVGFSTAAAAAAIVQWKYRAYPHYGLLGAPFLIISAVIVTVMLFRWASARLGPSPWLSSLALILAVIPVASHIGTVRGLTLWPPPIWTRQFYPRPWHTNPGVERDLAQVRALVSPGDVVLVLPPSRNDVPVLLDTRVVSFQYGDVWPPPRGFAVRAVRSAECHAVLVVHAGLDDRDRLAWQSVDADAAIAELPNERFRIAAALPTMTLWRRMPTGR